MVSIIIPTYGSPRFLKGAIESVFNQTYTDWELIIVDDNNPKTEERKRTADIVRQFTDDPRVRYVEHEYNKNGAAARNTGLSLASGNYVSFLDSDDIYIPERLAKCVDALEKNTQYDAVYTGCEFRKGEKKYSEFTKLRSGNFLTETLATVFRLCTGSNLFLRRSVIDEMKGFDEAFIRHQDYEFMVRFFQGHNIYAIPDVLVIKNNENINRPNPDKMLLVKKQYLSKYEDVILKLPLAEQKFIYYKHSISVAEHYMQVGLMPEGMRFYRKAIGYKRLGFHDFVRGVAFLVLAVYKRISR